MAHGLGSTRDIRLNEYAFKFAQAGFSCFIFDYRNNGDSKGEKRYRINVKEQLEDWRSAVYFVKTLDSTDTDNIFLFGTSFSGGHIITLASESSEYRGVIAQCPYTDGAASISAVPFITQIKLFAVFCAGCLIKPFGRETMVRHAGKPGKTALMTDKRYEYYLDMMTRDSVTFKNTTPVFTILEFLKYSPGKNAGKIKIPILYGICETDTVAPAKKSVKYAEKSEKATIKYYPRGHFDVYDGENFQRAIKDYIEFFKSHVKC